MQDFSVWMTPSCYGSMLASVCDKYVDAQNECIICTWFNVLDFVRKLGSDGFDAKTTGYTQEAVNASLRIRLEG